jgi:magnesium transporter
MTITLQGLHSQRIDWRTLSPAVWKEFLTALMLGAASGIAVGGVAGIWKGQPILAFSIAASIFLAMVTACLLGVLLPTAARALRIDPRIAAGPIVLASSDLATLLFYFNLAQMVLV